MEQKLFTVETFPGEVVYPQELMELMNSGWKIVQISAYGYAGSRNDHEGCVLLLQRELTDKETK